MFLFAAVGLVNNFFIWIQTCARAPISLPAIFHTLTRKNENPQRKSRVTRQRHNNSNHHHHAVWCYRFRRLAHISWNYMNPFACIGECDDIRAYDHDAFNAHRTSVSLSLFTNMNYYLWHLLHCLFRVCLFLQCVFLVQPGPGHVTRCHSACCLAASSLKRQIFLTPLRTTHSHANMDALHNRFEIAIEIIETDNK